MSLCPLIHTAVLFWLLITRRCCCTGNVCQPVGRLKRQESGIWARPARWCLFLGSPPRTITSIRRRDAELALMKPTREWVSRIRTKITLRNILPDGLLRAWARNNRITHRDRIVRMSVRALITRAPDESWKSWKSAPSDETHITGSTSAFRDAMYHLRHDRALLNSSSRLLQLMRTRTLHKHSANVIAQLK